MTAESLTWLIVFLGALGAIAYACGPELQRFGDFLDRLDAENAKDDRPFRR